MASDNYNDTTWYYSIYSVGRTQRVVYKKEIEDVNKKGYQGLYELEHAFEEETENKSSLKNVGNKKVTYTVFKQTKNMVFM